MSKKLNDKTRSEALITLVECFNLELGDASKSKDVIAIAQKRIAQGLALMVVETDDELDIARLWLAFEQEIIRMRGMPEKDVYQLVLQYSQGVKSIGKK